MWFCNSIRSELYPSRAKLQYNSMKVDTYDRSPWPDDTEANQEWCEEVISLVSSTIVKKSARDLKDPKVSPFKMFNLHIIKGLSSSWIRAISVAGIMILQPLWMAAKVCFQVYVWEPLNGQVCTQKQEAHKSGTNWLSSHGLSYCERGSEVFHRTFLTLSHLYSLLLQGLNYCAFQKDFPS